MENPKLKTIPIDARYKGIYFQASQLEVKESIETLKNRHVFWNYMMNVSMQNTLVQLAKRAE